LASRRLLAVATTALLCAGICATPVRAEECSTVLGCGEDVEWAVDLERKIADNMWDGQIYEVDYKPGVERTRSSITSVNRFGDSALWTGTYLAAESYRYALANKKLAKLVPLLPPPKKARRKPRPVKPPTPLEEEIAFWRAQKTDAKLRVDQMVAKYHVLVNISKYWNHSFQPSTAQAGFGGGVFNGEPGYLMRACIPSSEPASRNWSAAQLGPDPTGMPRPYTADRRVFGPFPWENADGSVTEYFCEDGTSRDAYAGATFGLLTAFDLVSPDDEAMRTQVRDDFITLTDFASKYYWSTPRPHGRLSIPIGSNWQSSPCKEINAVLRTCGHDFENFISPLFVITPIARVNLALGAYHVAHAAPGRDDVAKWDALWTEELLTQGPDLALEMQIDATQPYQSYYKHNLNHLLASDIIRLAPDAATRTLFMQAAGVMDKTTGDDINAHFETLTFAMTGERSRLDAATEHLRQWRDYRTRIETGVPTDNKSRCGVDLE
jgi:hypothetical protein